jgi:uncharacterized protein YbjT (DUF2867 family)
MEKTKDVILVTGSTGHQGGATAHELLRRGYQVRAMTRKPEGPAAQALSEAGAKVVAGDLNDPESLRKALAGAWGVYGLQNTWEAGVEGEEEQGLRLAELARQADVQHYVYASVASADRGTGIPHFENKFRVEERVRSLRFPSHVVIRPVFFMENLLGPFLKPAIDQGRLEMAVKPTTSLQMIAVPDIGMYGALAFELHNELNGDAIDIAGDEMTLPEVAAVLSTVRGRPVRFVSPPIEQVRAFSADYAVMLEWFDEVGYDVDIAANAARFGVKPTRFVDWARSADWSVAA